MPTLLAPPIVDDISRRSLLTGIGAAGLLTACAAGPAPAAPPAATRQVTDRLDRVVEVPVDPQRVVVLDPARALVDLVALGVVPVGSTTAASNGGTGFPPVLGPAAANVAGVGDIGQAAPERIAALEPDLVLFATDYQEDLSLDTLTAIAPVVAYERPQFGLLEPLRFFGEILGRQDRAAELEREFVHLITERRARLQLDGRRVATVNLPSPADPPMIQVLGPNAGFSPVLALLGATYAPTEFAGTDFSDVSAELVTTALTDVDLVIGLRFLAGQPAPAEDFTTSPLWQAVPAVAAGAVAYLDGQQAFANYGLAGVEAALDDLATQLG